MAFTGAEVRKGHLTAAANFGVDAVDLAGETERRKPFAHGVGAEEGLVDLLGRCLEHTVKLYSPSGFRHSALLVKQYLTTRRLRRARLGTMNIKSGYADLQSLAQG